jgi:hypothetical protein
VVVPLSLILFIAVLNLILYFWTFKRQIKYSSAAETARVCLKLGWHRFLILRCYTTMNFDFLYCKRLEQHVELVDFNEKKRLAKIHRRLLEHHANLPFR